MRLFFAAFVLLSAAAVAAPPSGKHGQDNTNQNATPPHGRGHVPDAVKGNRGELPGVRRERRGKHRRGDDEWLYPYPPFPSTWPYPAYPYSQYYYPYPPQFHANDGYPDHEPENSLRGLVVPGDLPTGQTNAFWFYCDTPDGYYPYVKSCTKPWTSIPVSPPPPGTATPLSFAEWQWCEESKSFFPYVTSCREGFTAVPVTAPSGTTPQAANWFFCENPKGYAPYVVQCAKDWRAVPSVPPPSVKVTLKDDKDAKK